MSLDRHYRAPSSYRWMLRSFMLFMFSLIVLALTQNEGGTFGVVVGILALVGVMGAWLLSERSWPQAGVYESEEGLRVVRMSVTGGLQEQLLPWRDITAFVPGSYGFSRRAVRAMTATGMSVMVTGAKQGALFRWEDGETNDITNVLNDRLALWRATQASAPAQ